MMKSEFECTKCCICYKNDCNKDFKECEKHGKKAQEGFKIKHTQKPNKIPILKTKYPITTTTTAITITSTTKKAIAIKQTKTTKAFPQSTTRTKQVSTTLINPEVKSTQKINNIGNGGISKFKSFGNFVLILLIYTIIAGILL
uniref:Uncharacterized protein n=1 Tax=Meloidogyne enterolobii TaxID=390850 RepID=A0A6V7W9J5_MELEN|nr:unnamed protein product [Meloidogyne enterolobii]